jgi:hypothetical protein
LVLRRADSLDHHPLYLFCFHQGLQKSAEPSGPELQKVHHFGEAFRRPAFAASSSPKLLKKQ